MNKTLAIGLFAMGAATLANAPLAMAEEPPMNNFNSAYYSCDNDAAFQVNYDARRPKEAELTTSNNNKTYTLKRTPAKDAATFAADAVKFSVKADGVTVEGTEIALQNCKRKS